MPTPEPAADGRAPGRTGGSARWRLMKCWSRITPGSRPRPARTSTFSASITVKSPSPVIMRLDMQAVPALVPPNTTPLPVALAQGVEPARWSRSTSMMRPWSPPAKKTPVARSICRAGASRSAADSGGWAPSPGARTVGREVLAHRRERLGGLGAGPGDHQHARVAAARPLREPRERRRAAGRRRPAGPGAPSPGRPTRRERAGGRRPRGSLSCASA